MDRLFKRKVKLLDSAYQKLNAIQKRQATIDLEELVSKGFIEKIGKTGRDTLQIKGALMGHKDIEWGINGANGSRNNTRINLTNIVQGKSLIGSNGFSCNLQKVISGAT